MRLFLSYVRMEQELIEGFATRLRRAGFEVFLDTGLTGGQRWWDELIRQIQLCDGFLPVLTKGYLLSRPCKLEAAYATALGKPILPVQMDEISPRLLSPAIGDVQWVRYSEEDVNSLLDLVKALNSLPACPQLPDPLPEAPPLPVSYMEQLVERVSSEQELTRADQREMLIELRSRLGGEEDEDARELLRRLKRRSDLQHVIALDIDEALTEPPTSTYALADERSGSVVSDSGSEWDLTETATDVTTTIPEHIASRSDLRELDQATSFGGVPDSPEPDEAPPPGGSDDGSGDRTGGNQHGGRRRPWLIGAAAGVVVLAAVGVVLGLSGGGGSPKPKPTTPTMPSMDAMAFTGGMKVKMTVVDQSIKAHLDPLMRKEGRCQAISNLGWDGESIGAISCFDPHNSHISVTYVKIDNPNNMQVHFGSYVTDVVGASLGVCLASPGVVPDTTAWQQDVPRVVSSDGPAAGADLLCFRQGGHPAIVWTNEGFNVIAQARTTGGVTAKALTDFWVLRAGMYEKG